MTRVYHGDFSPEKTLQDALFNSANGVLNPAGFEQLLRLTNNCETLVEILPEYCRPSVTTLRRWQQNDDLARRIIYCLRDESVRVGQLCDFLEERHLFGLFGFFVEFEQPEVKELHFNELALPGHRCVLKCETTGYPAPLCDWYFLPVGSSQPKLLGTGKLLTYTIEAVNQQHMGHYWCEVYNNSRHCETRQSTKKFLNVLVPPKIPLVTFSKTNPLFPKNGNVKYEVGNGRLVVLEVGTEVTFRPEVQWASRRWLTEKQVSLFKETVSWFRVDSTQPLVTTNLTTTKERGRLQVNSNSVTFKQVNSHHEGRYFCKVNTMFNGATLYQSVYGPFAVKVDTMAHCKASLKVALLIGNKNYLGEMKSSKDDLRHTKDDIQRLKDLLNVCGFDCYCFCDLTQHDTNMIVDWFCREIVCPGAYVFFHIASHGCANPDRPHKDVLILPTDYATMGHCYLAVSLYAVEKKLQQCQLALLVLSVDCCRANVHFPVEYDEVNFDEVDRLALERGNVVRLYACRFKEKALEAVNENDATQSVEQELDRFGLGSLYLEQLAGNVARIYNGMYSLLHVPVSQFTFTEVMRQGIPQMPDVVLFVDGKLNQFRCLTDPRDDGYRPTDQYKTMLDNCCLLTEFKASPQYFFTDLPSCRLEVVILQHKFFNTVQFKISLQLKHNGNWSNCSLKLKFQPELDEDRIDFDLPAGLMFKPTSVGCSIDSKPILSDDQWQIVGLQNVAKIHNGESFEIPTIINMAVDEKNAELVGQEHFSVTSVTFHSFLLVKIPLCLQKAFYLN